MSLFTFFPCIGVTDYPCNTDDTLELAAEFGLYIPYLTLKQRRDDAATAPNHGSAGRMYLQPESVVIHVDDPLGRDAKEGGIIWSTSKVMGLAETFDRLSTSWTLNRAVTVTAPGGGNAPGRWTLATAGGFAILDAGDSTKVTGTPTTVANYQLVYPSLSRDVEVKFSTLGTYVALLEIIGELSGTTYTDSAPYAFHVGPLADLEVRDAGANQGVAGNRRAYTIEAVNHGPSDAGAVEVALTGVPQGAVADPSQGSYTQGACQAGLCEGVWIIGGLEAPETVPFSGKSASATLAITADGDPVTATIESARDYTVCIDGIGIDVAASSESACEAGGNTWHSAEYYEPYPGNNTAQIASHAGTGEGHPDAPSGLRVVETPVANIIMWQPVERVNGHEVTHYQVQRSASPWTMLPNNPTGTIYVDMTGGGQLLPYRVRAVNGFGAPGPWSLPSLTAPDAPGDFTAAQLSDGVVELTWTRPDGNGAEIDGYTLQVSTDGGGSWADVGAQLDGGDTAWVHRDASLGAGRLYRIRAITARGPGPWAESASAVVGAPSLTALAQGPNEIWLSWTMPGGDDALVREYQLEHSADGRSFRTLAAFPAGGDMFYLHENLPPNATRHYRVRAGTELGHGPWSEVRSASTGPGAPRNFRAQADGPGEIALSWDAPSVRDAAIHEYELDQSTDGGQTWRLLAIIPAEEGTAYVHRGLSDGETRHYRVRASAYYGGSPVAGEWSPARSATTAAGVPEAPKDLAAEADGENTVKLSWTEPADNGSPITGYRIEHSPDGGATWQRVRDRHPGTSYSHGGLLSGTTHHYRVAALNRNGRSEFSNVASAVTGGDATTAPGTPTDLRVTGVERDRVSIAWGPPQDDGGTRVTGYEYRYAGPCANAPQDVCEGETRTTRGTSATVSGLKTAGSYDFHVRAVNALGAGEWAGPVRAVVNPEARGRIIVTPASLTVNEGGSATYRVKLSTSPAWPVQVVLFWDGDHSISDSLAGRQGMVLLPTGYPLPEDGSWDGWAFPWNVGVPITVEAAQDDDAEDGTVLVDHEVYAVPCGQLDDPEDCAPDPVYDGMIGPSVKITVRDDD